MSLPFSVRSCGYVCRGYASTSYIVTSYLYKRLRADWVPALDAKEPSNSLAASPITRNSAPGPTAVVASLRVVAPGRRAGRRRIRCPSPPRPVPACSSSRSGARGDGRRLDATTRPPWRVIYRSLALRSYSAARSRKDSIDLASESFSPISAAFVKSARRRSASAR